MSDPVELAVDGGQFALFAGFESEDEPVAPDPFEQLPLAQVKVVACPTCQAASGKDCRRPSGHRAMYGEPHIERVRAARDFFQTNPSACVFSRASGAHRWRDGECEWCITKEPT